MKSLSRSRSFCVALLGLVGALVGCDEPLKFGQVSGTLTLNGKPLNEALIMFLPEPSADGQGAHSESVSDQDGNYQLVYSLDVETQGAIVGQHRVIVQDIAAENARGKHLPIRFNTSFSSATRSPLTAEVAPGEQTIDFELGKRK